MRPEVGHLKLEPRLDLPVGVFGQTNPARLANPFQPGRDVHAVAHEVAVRFLDDVPKMNADAKLDTTFGRKASVALDHASLHLERAAHGVDHAAELDDDPIAGAFDDAAVMGGDGGVDEVAAEPAKTRQRCDAAAPLAVDIAFCSYWLAEGGQFRSDCCGGGQSGGRRTSPFESGLRSSLFCRRVGMSRADRVSSKTSVAGPAAAG